jgi:hypothetical protein
MVGFSRRWRLPRQGDCTAVREQKWFDLGDMPMRQLSPHDVPEILRPNGQWVPYPNIRHFLHEAEPVSEPEFDLLCQEFLETEHAVEAAWTAGVPSDRLFALRQRIFCRFFVLKQIFRDGVKLYPSWPEIEALQPGWLTAGLDAN